MLILQSEVPLLFKLVESLTHYPMQALAPVLNRLMELSVAPFSNSLQSVSVPQAINMLSPSDLSYFPQLNKFRERGDYTSDCSTSSLHGRELCNKKSYRHLTLLPGIFTLFCEHGKLNQFVEL